VGAPRPQGRTRSVKRILYGLMTTGLARSERISVSCEGMGVDLPSGAGVVPIGSANTKQASGSARVVTVNQESACRNDLINESLLQIRWKGYAELMIRRLPAACRASAE
jgi:hypothetical protein